jgi:hypothetical protein
MLCLSRPSHLLIVLDIDDRFFPFASWDLTLEQDVNLAVRSTFHLRQVDVCCDEANEAGGTPDITTLATKVSTLHDLLVVVSRQT